MWIAGETKVITVIADEDTDHKAYYKVRGSSDSFEEISGDFEYMGDRVYELACSFEAGEYIIRTNNLSQGFVEYLPLSVIEMSMEDKICQCSTTSAEEVKVELGVVATNTRQLMLAMGDDIKETATTIKYNDGVRVFM